MVRDRRMTVQMCATLCQESPQPTTHFALGRHHACFCGSAMTRATTVDDQLCLSGCAGDGTIKCGGHSSRPGDYVRRAAVYRLTPLGGTGLADKDSGDPAGDVYFGLEEKITPMHCRKNPGF